MAMPVRENRQRRKTLFRYIDKSLFSLLIHISEVLFLIHGHSGESPVSYKNVYDFTQIFLGPFARIVRDFEKVHIFLIYMGFG